MATAHGGEPQSATATSDRSAADRLVAPPGDRTRLADLNTLFDTRLTIEGGGLRGWLTRLVLRLAAPVLERQLAFNAALVEHLNRQIAVDDATHDATGRTVQYMKARLEARIGDASAQVLDVMQREHDARLAGDVRRQEAVQQVLHAQADLRGSIAVLQQSAHMLTREVERLRTSGVAAAAPAAAPPGAPAATPAGEATTLGATTLDSYKYVGFEDRFRGSAGDIRERQLRYAALFEGASDVLDVGCGRGEFVGLLRERGVRARGLDLNHAMVEVCRGKGLDVAEGDALSYLDAQPAASLGGLVAMQVVEHLQPDYLLRFLSAAYAALKPGSVIVLETINPACWFAFFESYIRDITHVRPLHPDTLSYLLTASGFQQVEVRYAAPYPDADKLHPVAAHGAGAPPELGAMIETVNANVERLNALLFTNLDYAAIGRRL